MSISHYVDACELLFSQKLYEPALTLICCAIDACAKQARPTIRNNKERIVLWLSDNIEIITRESLPAAFGRSCRFKFGNEMIGLKADADGYATFEEMVYYTIRCCLVHEARISSSIKLVHDSFLGYDNESIFVPLSLMQGLQKAVKISLHKQVG